MSGAGPCPLPKAPMERVLREHVAEHLAELRAKPIPPQRHEGVTLLIYWFPKADPATGIRPTDFCEFALRQTLTTLGALPTTIVTDHTWPELNALANALGATIQEEPTLTQGDIWSMTGDCIARLSTRFTTRHVLVVQHDGWPLRDDLARFLRYDVVGAPDVKDDARQYLADFLGLTTLNGGFTLRSRRFCKAEAWRWKYIWRFLLPNGHPWLSEDVFCTRTLRFFDPLFRLTHRFAPARIARQFSQECLDGAQPLALDANPMGFHGRLTAATLLRPNPKLTVVSAVRDHAMHARCIRENPHLAGAEIVVYDNTQENLPIPVRYNTFLKNLPADAEWILFAHEDFQPLEDPRPLLARANPLFPYGLIGTRKVLKTFILPVGSIQDCQRDGSDPQTLAAPRWMRALLGNTVEAVDCCGLFVHADAFRTWGYRFDEACAWDLYAEDLCFQHQCKTGHLARVLPLLARHWSRGNPASDSFKAALAHLNTKYEQTFFAGGTCVATIGGTPPRRFRIWRRIVRLLGLHKR